MRDHRVPLLLLLVALAAACVRYVAVQAPDGAPAPPFAGERVHGVMGQLGVRVHAVERILREGPPDEAGRAEVARLLGEIEGLARSLSVEDLRASHPALAANLDGFLADVRRAHASATSEPPDYFLAGSISGACAACHGPAMKGVQPRRPR